VRQRVIYDYRDLTRAFVETSDYDLVLWPESAMPGHFTFPWVQKYLNDMILKGEDFYLLSGIEEGSFDGEEIYNSVFLLKGSTENYQNHRKVHLVPLGEYLPWRESFPIFEWILGRVITLDFTAGETTEPLILEKEGHRIGVAPLICFEDTVPRHARKFIRPGPQIFVNVTNDGWFYDSAEPMQHFHNALFRCIEMRRPMIRAANTGVSAFIDERGSVYDREDSSGFARILADEETGSTYIRGSLPGTVRVALDPPVTFYARHGDIFSAGLGGLALVYWLSLGLRRRFRKG
ncbi:MAG: apolipoprotein N-acyltransferase, partial [Verrucomicrobiota bacterium]